MSYSYNSSDQTLKKMCEQSDSMEAHRYTHKISLTHTSLRYHHKQYSFLLGKRVKIIPFVINPSKNKWEYTLKISPLHFEKLAIDLVLQLYCLSYRPL